MSIDPVTLVGPMIGALVSGGIAAIAVVWNNGKTAERNESLAKELAKNREEVNARFSKLERQVQGIHDEQIKATEIRSDVAELKSGFLELTKALTAIAVVQTQTALFEKELGRTRDRMHDIENNIHALLSWRTETTRTAK